MTTTVLDTKNGVVLNKRPNASSLVTTTVLNKILGHVKCISTLKFNKCDAKLKQANLATNHDLNAISQIANQNKKNLLFLQPCYCSYFLEKLFLGDDSLQNLFVYTSKFNILKEKEDEGTEYITAWKSKGLFKSRLHPLYTFAR